MLKDFILYTPYSQNNPFLYIPFELLLLSLRMHRISIWVIVSLFLVFYTVKSVDNNARDSLVEFYRKLSGTSDQISPVLGWNLSSDPCKSQWTGIICDNNATIVTRILLDASNFTGIFNSSILCIVPSLSSTLSRISLSKNHLSGVNLDEIAKCKQITHLNVSDNSLSGTLPSSLSGLVNLKFLNVSWNSFSGDFPDLSRISGLQQLFAEKNSFTGSLPNFNFPNFLQFNVSFNNFTGSIPNGGDGVAATSFIGNPELCGDPLPKKCPPLPHHSKRETNAKNQILMYLGYIFIAVAILVIIIFKLCRRVKEKDMKVDSANKLESADDSISYKPSVVLNEKTEQSKSDASGVSIEGGPVSSSLVILTSPEVNGLKFEELLRAPAELIGRGKHGTVYKVICDQGLTLAVKRISGWTISEEDFTKRMKRLDQVKHPNVLPAAAFYCSKQEKLLVYGYQQNGCLSSLLTGTKVGRAFEWSSRLSFAAAISNALTFMHKELHKDKIGHGNLKSSNILLNKDMDPIITEYGLMEMNEDDQLPVNFSNSKDAFKSDIHGLGVILLELLTGKMVQTNGVDLAKWVLAVVREEWTVEVFDRSLIQEGASEERMVNLLQIAIKCVDHSLEARPDINQVAMMINTLKEEEERSLVSESGSRDFSG